MKILITSGAGYIGSTVSNFFLDLGFDVTVIDNLSTSYKFLIPKKAKFIKTDISNKKILKKHFANNRYDFVIHLAAFTKIKESIKRPSKYIINNYHKSKIFLDLCFKFNFKRIIFSSTAAVYSNSKKGFVSENSFINPNNSYAESKLLTEKFLKKKCKNEKGQYIILRYFNVAGAYIKSRSGSIYQDSLIKNITNTILRKDKVFNVYGSNYVTNDGTAIRDYIHVMNLVNIHFYELKYLLKNKKNLVLNCAYGQGFSVNQILEIIKKNFTKKLFVKYLPRRKGDLPSVISENKRLKNYFKWRPIYNNNSEILKSELAWQKKINNLTFN
jgi:UDP-glucose 4-epimerase